MGTWETVPRMLRRAEVRMWKHIPKPPMSGYGVSVALVVGGRESRPQGEGPQLERCASSHPAEYEGLGILANVSGTRKAGNPLRRSPCAVKAARTVATGGMERRAERNRALSLPTHYGSEVTQLV
jgi:hypothetical protein